MTNLQKLLFVSILLVLFGFTSKDDGEVNSSNIIFDAEEELFFFSNFLFQDDFETNMGWTVNPNLTDGITASTSGQWQRGNPTGTNYQNNITVSGTNALVTGAPNTSDGSHDIDGGLTSIQSPAIAIPAGSVNATLQFSSYLAHDNRSGSSDFLRVTVIGTPNTVVFNQLATTSATSPTYTNNIIDLSAYVGQTINILIEAQSTTASFVEASVDDLSVTVNETLPWNEFVCDEDTIILHNGVAAVTCGTTTALMNPERYTFALISLNDGVPAMGRSEITNMDSVYHHPSWHVDSIGNVFGVAINDKSREVLITASSNYGHIFWNQNAVIQYGSIGGGANDLNAAGTVYRIDPFTGQASVFAVLPQQSTTFRHRECEANGFSGSRTTGVGLGNIAYDSLHNQYFVTNIEDGRIYRLSSCGEIMESYDPLTYDDGVAGISILEELPYGVAVEPGSQRLFFGIIDSTSTTGNADPGSVGIYSINLTNGAFSGTIDNTYLPTGATYDNYVGTDSLHISLATGSGFSYTDSTIYVASDLTFAPNGDLLVGIRISCLGSFFSSYNHWGETSILTLNTGNNLYDSSQEVGISVVGDAGSEDGYGGVGYHVLPDGSVNYVASSSDILAELGPHGLAVWPADSSLIDPDTIFPLGAFSYGLPDDDPKGTGGDLEVFNFCNVCTVTSNSPVCEIDTLFLSHGVSADSTYWTGPNSFSSSELNPFIDSVNLSHSGTYKVVLFDLNGCAFDSCETVVTILARSTGSETYDGCQGDGYSVMVNGTTYNESNQNGTEIFVGAAANGCDSVVTVNLTYKPNATGSETYDGCQGDGYSVMVGSSLYNEGNPSGMDTLVAANGCDSVVTTTLVFKPNATGSETYDGCQGDGYNVMVGTSLYNEGNPSGIDTLVAANGCDSVVTTSLIFKPNATGTETYDGCQGDGYSVMVGTSLYNEGNPSGIDTLVAANGCDSVVTTTLVFKPNATGSETYDGCQGDGYSVMVGTSLYNEGNPSGIDTLIAANGCDSVVTTTLVYKPNATGTETYDGCQGDGYSVMVGTSLYNEGNPSGIDTLVAANGCDSVVTTTLVFKPNATGNETYDGCQGDGYSVMVGTSLYNEGNPIGIDTLVSANGCDSVVITTLVFKPNATGSETYDGCQGDGYSVMVGTSLYNEGNPSGIDTLVAANGCDSVVITTLVFKPNATGSETYDGCQGDGYSVMVGISLYNEGNPSGIDTLVAANGCDSVVTTTLVFKPNATGSETYDGCQGDGYSVMVGTSLYNEGNPSGIDTLVAANGCDSVVTTTLVFKPNATGTETYDGCQGDGYSVMVGTSLYNEGNPSGIDTLVAANGCDSVVTTSLIFKPNATGTETYDGCQGDGYSVMVGTSLYNEGNPSGIDTLVAANGCDSVVTTTLVFKPNATGSETYDGCQGDGYSVMVGTSLYNEGNPSGIDTLVAANGCDSVVTTTLVFKPNATGTETYDGCQGDGYSVMVGTSLYNEGNPSGIDTLVAANGCDSVVTTTLVFKPNATGTETYDGCQGDGYSVMVGTSLYNEGNQSGIDTLVAANGCDSVVTTTLVFKPNATGTETYDGCQGDGYSVMVGTSLYNEGNPSGIDTLVAANGCDSVVTTSLIFKPNATGTETYDGCQGDGYSVMVGSSLYNEGNPSGIDTLVAANGCDSVVTTTLIFKPNATGSETYDGCQGDGYNVMVGTSLYNEGNPSGIDTLVAANGCDSVVTTSLIFKPNATGSETYDGCQGDGYSVMVGTSLYNEVNPSGIDTLVAANGCDSVVTTTLVFKPNVTGSETYDGCQGDGYSVMVGISLYNEGNPSGIDTLFAANGCDSVVTTTLVFKPNATGSETYDGCQGDGYSVMVGTSLYNEGNPSGIDTLVAANGCDSVVTTTLVFKPNATGTETYDGCQGDGYSVMVGTSLYNEGNPSGIDTLVAANGCDSVVTTNLVFKPNATGTETYDGCQGDGYSVMVGTSMYNEGNPSGIDTLIAANGCDSVVTTTLVFKPNATGTETYDGCQGDGYSVMVGTSMYNEGNPSGIDTLVAANGCDSVVTTTLVFKPNATGTETYDGCQGDGYSVMVGSSLYNEGNPSGIDTLVAANGCDSVVTTTLIFKPNATGTETYDGCQGDGYSVMVGSSLYNEGNPSGIDTLVAANGCDSVVTTTLVFKPNATGSETYDGCQGDGYSVMVGSSLYNEGNPSGIDTLVAANGCDQRGNNNLNLQTKCYGN